MDQQKGWAIPLLLAVGASCYTAVHTLAGVRKANEGDAAGRPNAGGRVAGGKRRTVMDNPYNRNVPRTPQLSHQNNTDRDPVSTGAPDNWTSATNGSCSRTADGLNSSAGVPDGWTTGPAKGRANANGNGALVDTSASSKPFSSGLVTYFNPTDADPESLYTSVPISASSITPLGIRGSYQVRLGPLHVIVRPGFALESDDYRFPIQCYRYRHSDGSLLTLIAEECTASSWPMSTDEYIAHSVDVTRAAAERGKAYFKVKLNVNARDVVTTVMERYVNLHIGPVPIVVASFFLVRGSLALTIQLQAHVAQYQARMADLFATVQNARLDDLSVRRFSTVSRGGQSTYALKGSTFRFHLTLPTTLSMSTKGCADKDTDAAGHLTVASVLHRSSPRWEARIVIRPQSKWRLVRWLQAAQAASAQRHCDPLTTDPYEFPLVPEMASLVVDQDTVTDLAGVTAMVEALLASGALFMEVPSTAPVVPSQKTIGWLPTQSGSGDNSSVTSASASVAEDWLLPSSYFPRYESVYWSLPLPSPESFDASICEHAGDNTLTMFIHPINRGPSDIFELEPMLLHCGCAGGAYHGNGENCVAHFIERSAVLFTEAVEPSVYPNHGNETCVVLEGLSSARPQLTVRLAAVHIRNGDGDTGDDGLYRSPRPHLADDGDAVDYWIVYRWIFAESKTMPRELRQYENQLLQNGRPC